MSLARCVVVPLVALSLAAVARAGVIVVGTGPGADYPQIAQAVTAAASGDTILVRAGTYNGFIVDGKSLSIVGDAATRPTVTGPTVVRNLPAGATTGLGHFLMKGGIGAHGNAGFVRVVDCQIGMPDGTGAGGDVDDSTGGAAFERCSFHGHNGYSDGYSGDDGQPGLALRGAIAAVHDCVMQGGRGGDGLTWAANGGDGARVAPSTTSSNPTFLHASGCTFTGGRGGDTWEDIFQNLAVVGSGGDGIDVATGSACWMLDDAFHGGSPGTWHNCFPASYGSYGLDQRLGGSCTTFNQTRLAIDGPVLAREATTITLGFDGAPGDVVYLASGAGTQFSAAPSWRGVKLTRTRGLTLQMREPLPVAVLDGTGHASVVLDVPLLAPGRTSGVSWLQAYRVNPNGSTTMGGFLPVTVVGAGY